MKRVAWILGCAVMAGVGGSALGGEKVMVIPFNVLNMPTAQQWMGKGVEESLVVEMGRDGAYVPVPFEGQTIVEDNATAVRVARNAKVPLVIRGAVQVVGENVRLTAQLIDSQTGETVRSGMVTGSAGTLLAMEDELANQLRMPTPAAAVAKVATVAKIASTSAPTVPPPQMIVRPEPAVVPTYVEGYVTDYPYYFFTGSNLYSYPYGFYPLGMGGVVYYGNYPVVVQHVNPGHGGRGQEGRGGGGNGGGRGNDGGTYGGAIRGGTRTVRNAGGGNAVNLSSMTFSGSGNAVNLSVMTNPGYGNAVNLSQMTSNMAVPTRVTAMPPPPAVSRGKVGPGRGGK